MLRGRLWRHPDFLKLWAGETVSQFGTQVTFLAVPTVAILVLHAGPFQVGLLSALEFLAFPVLGLVAGVYACPGLNPPGWVSASVTGAPPSRLNCRQFGSS